MGSIAQDIGARVGVSPAIVQAFIALSRPVRLQLRSFLRAQEASLRIALGQLAGLSLRGDFIADKINQAGNATLQVLTPVNNLMSSIPLDSVVKESPELAALLNDVAAAVPLKIPATVATTIAGIGGFDFFDGIHNYRDLQNKLDELRFRAVRATALSTYANTGQGLINAQLDKISKYLDIIELLEVR